MKITNESEVYRKEEVVFSTIENEVVIMNIKSGNYYLLNSVSSSIWEIIENPIKVSDIYLKLLNKYKITPTQCKEDTLEILNKFLEENLINLKK